VSDRSTGTLLAWVAAAALGVLALTRLVGGGEDAPPAPVKISAGAPATAGRTAAPRSGVVVHVAGAVRRPGLVRVPEGARVATAVRRAGGAAAKADLNALNLAARVEDGQQVVVPATGPTAAGGGSGEAKVSLGSATVEDLDGVDGIGPTLAERIVEQRTKSGGFGSLGDLSEVDGIGEKRLQALREALQP
jgi:competence protein ComEA